MIGSFLTRGLVMVFGYAYPAYECYKTIELNKPEIEQLRFWCQYWILIALLTVCERIGDTFISWVPMYSEAKLAFVIYLWYPKTKGTTYVYDSFFRPYVAKHETEIDRNLLELRTRVGDMAVLYCKTAATYGQTRIFEILQYVASQSTPRPRPHQPGPGARQPPAATNHQPPAASNSQPNIASNRQLPAASNSQPNTASNRQPPAAANRQINSASNHQPPAAANRQINSASHRQPNIATQPQTEEPPSPTSSTSSNQFQKELPEKEVPSQVPNTALPAVSLNAIKPTVTSETTSQSTPTEAEAMEIEAVTSSANENVNPPPNETVMDESIQVARGRLRKVRSIATR